MSGFPWEIYLDDSYYHMWAVRDKTDKSFNSPRLFHFNNEEDARDFLHLINISHHAVRGKK